VTQIFLASTQYGIATVVAALRAGLFGPRGARRRLLLLSDNTAVPELRPPVERMAGVAALRDAFDAVRFWNEIIEPHHPAVWEPRPQDAIVWRNALHHTWELGDGPVDLVCESPHANPARALAAIFVEGPVHVYADGLMSYGPTREPVPPATGARVERLLHLDLVPGLRPLLLAEHGVEPVHVPRDAFRRALAELGAAGGEAVRRELPPGARPTAVLLGQHLSALRLVTPDEEEELYARMLRATAAAGHTDILFRPHPAAPARYSRRLEATARELGVGLTVLSTPAPAEVVFECLAPELVVGCFSTGLLTAARCYGIPAARVGTGLLLERVTPYQNSNRVPLTLVDAGLPDLEAGGGPDHGTRLAPAEVAERMAPLMRAVGYCMQARRNPSLRPGAAAWLAAHPDLAARYVTRERLASLGLPGGPRLRARALRRNRAVLRAVRTVRALQRVGR
jgi:hypothetical protein